MEREQQQEWQKLRENAAERLRQGNAPTRRGVRQALQLLVLPSFDSEIGWEICQDFGTEAPYFAIKTIWRQETDADKLETPVVRLRYPRPLEPTFEIQQFPLPTEWTETALAELKSLCISPVIDCDRVGLDGTSFELKFDEGFAKARYHWWEEPPAGWLPLHRWTQKTLEYLEKLETEK